MPLTVEEVGEVFFLLSCFFFNGVLHPALSADCVFLTTELQVSPLLFECFLVFNCASIYSKVDAFLILHQRTN